MKNTISIHYAAVDENSNRILNLADSLEPIPLIHADKRTTLSGVANCRNTYEEFRNVLVLLGESMAKEASNIKSLGLAFIEADQMEAELLAKKSSYGERLISGRGK